MTVLRYIKAVRIAGGWGRQDLEIEKKHRKEGWTSSMASFLKTNSVSNREKKS